jgi:hypothetical protein
MPRLYNSASPLGGLRPATTPLLASSSSFSTATVTEAEANAIAMTFDFEGGFDTIDGKPDTFSASLVKTTAGPITASASTMTTTITGTKGLNVLDDDNNIGNVQEFNDEEEEDDEQGNEDIAEPRPTTPRSARNGDINDRLLSLPGHVVLRPLPFQTPREPTKAGTKRSFELISTPKTISISSTTLQQESKPVPILSSTTPLVRGGVIATKAAAAAAIYEDRHKAKSVTVRGGDELERSRLNEYEAKLSKSASSLSLKTSSYISESLAAAKEQIAILKANFSLLSSVIDASKSKLGQLPNRAKLVSTNKSLSSSLVSSFSSSSSSSSFSSSSPSYIEVTLFGREEQLLLKLGPLTAEGCLPFREAMRARVQLLKCPLLQIQRKLESSGVSGMSGDEAGKDYMKYLKIYKDARGQLERLEANQTH